MGWLLDEAMTEFMKVICPSSVRTVNQYTRRWKGSQRTKLQTTIFDDLNLTAELISWSGPVMAG